MHTATTPTQIPEGNAEDQATPQNRKEPLRPSASVPTIRRSNTARSRMSKTVRVGPRHVKMRRGMGALVRRLRTTARIQLDVAIEQPPRRRLRSNRFLHPNGGSTTCSGGVTPHLSPRRDRGDPGWDARPTTQHVSKMHDPFAYGSRSETSKNLPKRKLPSQIRKRLTEAKKVLSQSDDKKSIHV